MRGLSYFVACSADGFIAAEDGSIGAFVDDGDYFAELFESFPRLAPATSAKHSGYAGRTSTSMPS